MWVRAVARVGVGLSRRCGFTSTFTPQHITRAGHEPALRPVPDRLLRHGEGGLVCRGLCTGVLTPERPQPRKPRFHGQVLGQMEKFEKMALKVKEMMGEERELGAEARRKNMATIIQSNPILSSRAVLGLGVCVVILPLIRDWIAEVKEHAELMSPQEKQVYALAQHTVSVAEQIEPILSFWFRLYSATSDMPDVAGVEGALMDLETLAWKDIAHNRILWNSLFFFDRALVYHCHHWNVPVAQAHEAFSQVYAQTDHTVLDRERLVPLDLQSLNLPPAPRAVIAALLDTCNVPWSFPGASHAPSAL